jgi:uncharacterized glyoxalase superfamily protein PhnB
LISPLPDFRFLQDQLIWPCDAFSWNVSPNEEVDDANHPVHYHAHDALSRCPGRDRVALQCAGIFEARRLSRCPNGTIGHAELTLGGGMIMLGSEKNDEYGRGFKSPLDLGAETRSTYVIVEDADAAYGRAQAAGAPVMRPLQNTDYGSREFAVKDPEGHSWSVGTYDPWKPHTS